jgi:uncharacterized protein (DUF488 family)
MTLYTSVYEGRSLPQFLAALGTHAVRLRADVREAPISRKPGFSKAALQQVLGVPASPISTCALSRRLERRRRCATRRTSAVVTAATWLGLWPARWGRACVPSRRMANGI